MSNTATAGERVEPILSLVGVTKRFQSVVALDDVSLDLFPGEVHVLLGENGAGKSTLVNVVIGAFPPNDGQLFVRGRPITHQSPGAARLQGINAVLQDFSLAPALDVADNIFLGREETRFGVRRRAAMRREAERAVAKLGVEIDVATPVRFLSRAEQQVVEIAKGISGRPGALILDEPTATLTEQETARLFEIVAQLKADGWGILYITHRLEEVLRLGDRVTVLRDGRETATFPVAGVTVNDLVTAMIGRPLSALYPRIDTTPGAVLLHARDLWTSDGVVRGVSFDVRAGEVVGLAGLVRCGKSEVARACFGLVRLVDGAVEIGGRTISRPEPRTMLDLGLVYLPQDRRGEALALSRTVEENISLETLGSPELSRFGMVQHEAVHEQTWEIAKRLALRPLDVHLTAGQFSGGNQQKIVLGRALTRPRHVYIFDEPTSGVDVGAKEAIYHHIRGLCEDGAGVVLVSSELGEIVNLSHRVFVMHEGRIHAELGRDKLTERAVVAHSFGHALNDA